MLQAFNNFILAKISTYTVYERSLLPTMTTGNIGVQRLDQFFVQLRGGFLVYCGQFPLSNEDNDGSGRW